METVLAAIIVILVILFGFTTLSGELVEGQDTLEVSWREMQARVDEQARTGLTASDSTIDQTGSVVEIAFENTHTERLADFDRWDLIVQYYDESSGYHIEWLTPVSGEPGAGQWSVVGIYQDVSAASPEVFERGILNPGEEMLVRLRLPSPAGEGTTNFATLSTDNGVNAPAFFVRPLPPTPTPTGTPDSTETPTSSETPAGSETPAETVTPTP